MDTTRHTRRAAFGWTILAAAAFTACDGGSTVDAPPILGGSTHAAQIWLNAQNFAINDGESYTIPAAVLDEDGEPVDADIAWSSSDSQILSVTDEGVVTGERPGTATITASVEEVTASASVTVRTVPVRLEYVSGSGQEGEPFERLDDVLLARLVDRKGQPVANVVVEFRVLKGGGAANPAATQTDAQGYARTVWMIGDGEQELAGVAQKPGHVRNMQDSVVVFSATAVAEVSPPAQVTDLQATNATSSSVTLRWTAVSDGAGDSASYAIRYGSPSLSWDAAAATEQQVAGVTPGGTVTHTVQGLAPGATHQFQVVAYRGTGSDAVRGQPSNVASASTASVVASVTATPSAAALSVGGAVQASAVARDGSGATVSGASLAWSSTNTAVASVDGNGLIRGIAAGTAGVIVRSTCCGPSDTIQVTVAADEPTGPAVVSVTATPQTHTFTPGEVLQASAVARDASGAVVSGAEIAWTSSNTSIASVDAMGRITALQAGTAMIVIAAVCCDAADTISATVQEPTEVVAPTAVTDLRMSDTGTASVTLQWTAVSDGAGGSAKYAIRYGSPTLNWGGAYSTEQTVPAGVNGQTLTHTFSGLAAGTGYQFRLVSYRGTLNQGAVFGGYSNTASATTETSGDEEEPSQAAINISPGGAVLNSIGATVDFSAEARSADGSIVSGADIVWTSLSPNIATVNDMGTVTAKAAGVALITATAICCSADTVAVTVSDQPSEPSELHPNEPAGMTVLGASDGSIAENGDGALGIPAFGDWYGHTGGGSQNVRVVTDAGNPTGSGRAVRLTWVTADREAALADMTLPSGEWTEVYIAQRVVQPACWTGSGSSHKWFYFMPEGENTPGSAVWTAQETNGNWRAIDGADNIIVNAQGVLDIRQSEMLMEYVFKAESSPGAGDGEVYFWLNGRLVGSGTNLQMAGGGYEAHWRRIHMYNHANEVPPGDCYFDMREFYVSGK